MTNHSDYKCSITKHGSLAKRGFVSNRPFEIFVITRLLKIMKLK